MRFWNPSKLWRLLGLAGPATGEILELQIVRLMVFAGPATDEMARFICKAHGLGGLPLTEFSYLRLPGLWS